MALAGTLAFLELNAVIAFQPSSTPFAHAAWVEDDFFYYAEIARNIAATGVSTFDGETLTNGYHPLWLWICTALAALFDTQSRDFFIAVFVLQSALVLLGVWALMGLMRAPALRRGIHPHAYLPAAVMYGIAGGVIGVGGMEIALLWPLLPLFCRSLLRLIETPDITSAIAATSLASLATLSRLDSAVVLFPLAFATLVIVTRRIGLRCVLALWPAALGFVPVFLYIASNVLIFGAAMPISGAAKRLLIEDAPGGLSLVSLSSFVLAPSDNHLIVPIAVSLLWLSAVVLVLARTRLRASLVGRAFLLLSVGVAGYHLMTALQSDWPLWLWYFYGVALAGSLAIALGLDSVFDLARARRFAGPISAAVACGLLLFAFKANAWMLRSPPSEQNALFTRAVPVMDFAKVHQGTYAMGDAAGAVGFMLDAPLVQLEGLVNDRRMIEDIEQGGSIADSLKRQGVDFYVYGREADAAVVDARGCEVLKEPLRGGPRTPHMTQTVCEAPLLSVRTGWLQTLVFDVRDGLD